MTNAIALDESSEEFKTIKQNWDKKSKAATLETLPDFLKELSERYNHDYGTICHAVAIGATAAAWAMNKSDQGGITGFQAGAIMWEFIRNWNYSSNKTGLKIVDYDNFLYPQYQDQFEKTLSASTWESIKEEAVKNIYEADNEYSKYLKNLNQYKIDIALFVEKYPDYTDNKKHYDHLGCGTSDEWDAEIKKKEDGFEFAPEKPFCPVNDTSPSYKHWVSIVDGVVPFGYVVTE